MTWCAVTSKGIVGPIFPQGNIDAAAYQNILKTEFLPGLEKLINIWFQQDGAPAHTARTTVQYLNKTFGTHWIGKGGKHNWPAGSPDLTVWNYW